MMPSSVTGLLGRNWPYKLWLYLNCVVLTDMQPTPPSAAAAAAEDALGEAEGRAHEELAATEAVEKTLDGSATAVNAAAAAAAAEQAAGTVA